MKHQKFDYEETEWFPPDESESCLSQKLLKTRVDHSCSFQHIIKKGDYALRQLAVVEDQGWKSCYICIPCMDKWLDEHG